MSIGLIHGQDAVRANQPLVLPSGQGPEGLAEIQGDQNLVRRCRRDASNALDAGREQGVSAKEQATSQPPVVQQLEVGVSTVQPDAAAIGGIGKCVDAELDDFPTAIDAVDAFFSRLVRRGLEHRIERVGQHVDPIQALPGADPHFGSRGEPDALDQAAILGVVVDAPLQKPVAVPVEEMEFVFLEAPQVSIEGVDAEKHAPRLDGGSHIQPVAPVSLSGGLSLSIQVQNGPGRPVSVCIGLDEGESGVSVGQDEGAGVALCWGQMGKVRTRAVKEEGVRPLKNVRLAVHGAVQDGGVLRTACPRVPFSGRPHEGWGDRFGPPEHLHGVLSFGGVFPAQGPSSEAEGALADGIFLEEGGAGLVRSKGGEGDQSVLAEKEGIL